MKALVVTPKNNTEFKFISDLLKKLDVGVAAITDENLEDIGLSKLMHEVDKTKKASRTEIIKKLSA